MVFQIIYKYISIEIEFHFALFWFEFVRMEGVLRCSVLISQRNRLTRLHLGTVLSIICTKTLDYQINIFTYSHTFKAEKWISGNSIDCCLQKQQQQEKKLRRVELFTKGVKIGKNKKRAKRLRIVWVNSLGGKCAQIAHRTPHTCNHHVHF